MAPLEGGTNGQRDAAPPALPPSSPHPAVPGTAPLTGGIFSPQEAPLYKRLTRQKEKATFHDPHTQNPAYFTSHLISSVLGVDRPGLHHTIRLQAEYAGQGVPAECEEAMKR